MSDRYTMMDGKLVKRLKHMEYRIEEVGPCDRDCVANEILQSICNIWKLPTAPDTTEKECEKCGEIKKVGRSSQFSDTVLISKKQYNDLKHTLKMNNHIAANEWWCWQRDEEDHLESLTCPVLIPAANLRDIVAERDSLKEKVAELEKEATFLDSIDTEWQRHVKKIEVERDSLKRQVTELENVSSDIDADGTYTVTLSLDEYKTLYASRAKVVELEEKVDVWRSQSLQNYDVQCRQFKAQRDEALGKLEKAVGILRELPSYLGTIDGDMIRDKCAEAGIILDEPQEQSAEKQDNVPKYEYGEGEAKMRKSPIAPRMDSAGRWRMTQKDGEYLWGIGTQILDIAITFLPQNVTMYHKLDNIGCEIHAFCERQYVEEEPSAEAKPANEKSDDGYQELFGILARRKNHKDEPAPTDTTDGEALRRLEGEGER